MPLVLGEVERTPRSVEAQPSPSLGETILLVEDDPQVRSGMGRMPESLEYRVLSAGDGEEALELARALESPIDLLLTDLVMVGLGGREVADRIRLLFPDTAVLYMSGYSDEAIIRRGVVDPNASFLEKPFATADLARRVREVLEHRSPAATR